MAKFSSGALILAVAAGAVFAWQVISISFAAGQESQFADFSASSYAAESEVAAVTASTQDLAAGDHEGAKVMARHALAISPISAAALRNLILAERTLRHGETAEASLSEAAALGWRDGPTQLLLADAYLKSQDYEDAAKRIDAIMRTNPKSEPLRSMLDRLIVDRSFSAAVARRLALNPVWRYPYLSYTANVPLAAMEARGALLEDLARMNGPLERREIVPVVGALAKLGNAAGSRSIWFAAQRLPEQPLYDPRFVMLGSTTMVPFEWTKLRVLGAGLEAGDSETPSAGGMRVSTEGSASGVLLRQQLALAPGSHRLNYAPRLAPALLGTFGWSVRCAKSGGYLSNSLTASLGPPYRFDVPSGCPVQLVELRVAGNSAAAGERANFTQLDVR